MRKQKDRELQLSEVQRRSWKAFYMVSHLMEEFIDGTLERTGMGPQSEYDLLYTLGQAPGHALTLKEVSASLTLSHSGVSRMVDRLEKRGYVARCGSEGDKRAVRIRLLEAGRTRVAEVWNVMSATLHERFGSALTDQQHLELFHLMNKLLPALIDEKEKQTGLPYLHRP